VSKFAPGNTTPSATPTGVSEANGLAFDGNGNLYVANDGNSTVSEFSPIGSSHTAGGAVIRSSLSIQPISLGGANNAVGSIDALAAEVVQNQTASPGTPSVSDSSQTANNTFTTATLAGAVGASNQAMDTRRVAAIDAVVLSEAWSPSSDNAVSPDQLPSLRDRLHLAWKPDSIASAVDKVFARFGQ